MMVNVLQVTKVLSQVNGRGNLVQFKSSLLHLLVSFFHYDLALDCVL